MGDQQVQAGRTDGVTARVKNAAQKSEAQVRCPDIWKHARRGDAWSQRELGLLYSKGYIGQDYEAAAHWYKKAASQGDAVAQRELGLLYQCGHGVQQSYEEAIIWFKKSADQGEALGQCNLGRMYGRGYGVQQNYEEAVNWFKKSADQGEAFGQLCLGEMYGLGYGVQQDYEEAASWFQKSADKGSARGQYALGELYARGHGVQQTFDKALYWLRKSADQGDARGQAALGELYELGHGVEQSCEVAACWYQKAADQGHALSQFNLGELYAEGLGLPQDWRKAFALFEAAARIPKRLDAQLSLAWLLWTGTGGVQQDRVRAEALCATVRDTEGYKKKLAGNTVVGPFWPGVLAWFNNWVEHGSDGKEALLETPKSLPSKLSELEAGPFLASQESPTSPPEAEAEADGRGSAMNPPGDSPLARFEDITAPVLPSPGALTGLLNGQKPAEGEPSSSAKDYSAEERDGGEQPKDDTNPYDASVAGHGEMLKELRVFLESSGGLSSLPVVPDERSRCLLQRLLSDKKRLVEAEERMKRSPEASAYFTEMHWRLGDLFVGAQALGSGKVQPAPSMPFVSVVLTSA
ncbi:hypothetical protein KFL_002760070 [Klebsormidium nitens]|uniref:Uncharacterized protein n=1 Tax=Klebsormidium nitens TaxID=105231 RepID=A0A1Y1I5H8_KLENI|nr:hypothetical protein KFL_002760070 [Klebsormidium nitens]|eukprot:GAQ86210.1 hypothetical protein KFL_002760070 [Klebsormidium nitens]